MKLRPERLLFAGMLASALGVIVAATIRPTVGGVILIVGWLVAIWGLHSFGRAGRSKLASQDDDAHVGP